MRPISGFTLVELVVTIVLVAILAISIWPRAPSQESITIRGRAEQLASDIRYVQTLSMTRGSRFCVVITGSNYELRTTDALNACTATQEQHPAGFVQPVQLCSGCIATDFGGTLQFDGKGRPYTAPATLLAANGVVTIAGDGGPKTVTVSPTTGRVIVQ